MADHVVQLDRAVFIRRQAVLPHSDRSDRAGVNNLLHAGFAAGRKQIARAADVVVVDVLRISGPEAVVGGNVIDAAATLDAAQQRAQILEIADGDLAAKCFDIRFAAGIARQDPDAVAS